MNRAMPTASSAAMVEDQVLVGHHGPPPPSYDKAVGPGQFVPPGVAPYPHQHIGMVVPPMQHVPPPLQHYPVPPSSTTVIVTGTLPLGPDPANLRCPNCNMDIRTTTVTENQPTAHFACLLLFLLGCCLCSCIPYCMDSFKCVNHSCPNCKTFLGSYKP